MAKYRWYDTEEGDENGAVGFEADTLESARTQAAYMFMASIGEQHEYCLPLTLINCDTGDKTESLMHIEMEANMFFS